MIGSAWFRILCRGPNAWGLNAMCWLPHHGFTRESHSQEIALAMNSHAVFIYLAGFQLNYISAYPAEMALLELELLHLATSLDMRHRTLGDRKSRIEIVTKCYLARCGRKAPNCARTTTRATLPVPGRPTCLGVLTTIGIQRANFKIGNRFDVFVSSFGKLLV